MPEIRTIKLAASGGTGQMSVFIGQAQFGEYVVRLRDQAGTKSTIAEGDNIDDEPDTFDLPTPVTALNGTFISWAILIKAPSSAPGQLYFARVSITQNGKVVPNGSIEYQGALDAAQNIVDIVRLEVA